MTTEKVTQYEVLFSTRTGVTVLLPRTHTLDIDAKTPALFHVSPDNPRDVTVTAGNNQLTLKDLRREHIDEAINRGFIMFYETEDDEVTRCTPCNYQKS